MIADRQHRFQSQQGVALVLVLWIIMVLSLLIGGFAFTMHVETQVASFNRKQLQAESLAQSGIEIVRMQLLLDEKSSTNAAYDALNQDWATNEMLYVDHELGEGKYNVKVIDEQSKLPVNRLTENDWKRLLELLGVEDSDSDVIVDSIIDWTDDNDLHQLNGAESDYYESLTPPYRAKNGPLDRVDELKLIRGITLELYNGLPSEGEEASAQPGLKDLLTTFSNGQVNVNTASRLTLQVMFKLDDVQVDAVLARRDGIDGIPGTEDDMPFVSAQDFLGQISQLDPRERAQLQRLVTVKSAYFAVKSTGESGGVKRTISAVLRRQAGKISVYSWKEQPGEG